MNKNKKTQATMWWPTKGGRNKVLGRFRNETGLQYLYYRPGRGRFDDDWVLWVFGLDAGFYSTHRVVWGPTDAIAKGKPLLIVEGVGGIVHPRQPGNKAGTPGQHGAVAYAITKAVLPDGEKIAAEPSLLRETTDVVFAADWGRDPIPCPNPCAPAAADEVLRLLGVRTLNEVGVREFIAETDRRRREARVQWEAACAAERAAEAARRAAYEQQCAAQAARFGAFSLPDGWSATITPAGVEVYQTGFANWMSGRILFADPAALTAWIDEERARQAAAAAAAAARAAAESERRRQEEDLLAKLWRARASRTSS